jgi:hypothetical protein
MLQQQEVIRRTMHLFLNKEGGGRNQDEKVQEANKLELILVFYLFMLFVIVIDLWTWTKVLNYEMNL